MSGKIYQGSRLVAQTNDAPLGFEDKGIELESLAQYEQLEKDGNLQEDVNYYIKGGEAGAIIDDETTSTSTTWSSEKISNKKQDKIINVTSAEYLEKVASGEITEATTDYYSIIDDQEDETEYRLDLYSIMDRTVMNGSSDNFYITKKGNKGYLHLRGMVGFEPSAKPTQNALVTVPEGWRPKHTFLNLLLTGWSDTSPYIRLARVAFFDDGRIKIRESDIPKNNTNSAELDFEYEIAEV